MRFKSKIAALLALLSLSACNPSSAAIIGGTYYAVQYDFAEFFAATDGRNFQVILVGNPFPDMDPNTVARDLLPALGDVPLRKLGVADMERWYAALRDKGLSPASIRKAHTIVRAALAKV